MDKVDNMATLAKATATSGGSETEPHPVYKNAVDELRKSLTCTICLRLLHEPFTTSCGHTFCYECLDRWFTENKSSKSCPDCRARIQQQPAQAFKIREMVAILCKDARLLPSGEGVEEHLKMSEEMTSLVETHRKAESGLFQGVFKVGVLAHAIYEAHDDVWRCPNCYCELMDFFCDACRLEFDEHGHPMTDNDIYSIGPDSDSDFDGGPNSDFFRVNLEHVVSREAQESRHHRPPTFARPREFHRRQLEYQDRILRDLQNIPNAFGAFNNGFAAGSDYEISSEGSEDYYSDQDDDQSDISGLIDDGDGEEEGMDENSSSVYATDAVNTPEPYSEGHTANIPAVSPISIGSTEDDSAPEDEAQIWAVGPANFSDVDEDESISEECSAIDDYGDEDEDGDDRRDRNSSVASESTLGSTPRPHPQSRSRPSVFDCSHETDDEEAEYEDDDEDIYDEEDEKLRHNEEEIRQHENDDDDDEEEEQDKDEVRKELAKQRSIAACQNLRKRVRVILSDEDSDDEDDDDIKPPSKKSRQTSPLPVRLSQPASTASTAALRSTVSSTNDEDDEDDDPIPALRVRERRSDRPRHSSSLFARAGPRGRNRRPFSVRA